VQASLLRSSLGIRNAERNADAGWPGLSSCRNNAGVFWVASPNRSGHPSRGLRSSRQARSSLRLRTVDVEGNEVEDLDSWRHDPCVGIRASPLARRWLHASSPINLLRHRGA